MTTALTADNVLIDLDDVHGRNAVHVANADGSETMAPELSTREQLYVDAVAVFRAAARQRADAAKALAATSSSAGAAKDASTGDGDESGTPKTTETLTFADLSTELSKARYQVDTLITLVDAATATNDVQLTPLDVAGSAEADRLRVAATVAAEEARMAAALAAATPDTLANVTALDAADAEAVAATAARAEAMGGATEAKRRQCGAAAAALRRGAASVRRSARANQACASDLRALVRLPFGFVFVFVLVFCFEIGCK
jgi:hypothetical protein